MKRKTIFFITFLAAFLFFRPQSFASETLLEKVESLYNSIFVYGNGDYISMTFGHNRKIFLESKINVANEMELPITYTRYMNAGVFYASKLEKALIIGLGGGRTSWYLHKSMPQLVLKAVELDPEVIRLAKKYFAIKEDKSFITIEQDGRSFLMKSKETFDIIMLDAYRGPFVPFHLLTKEFYTLVNEHLSPGGVVVQNIEPSTMLFDSTVATMLTTFDFMEFYNAGGNIIAVAYNGPKKSSQDLAKMARQRQEKYRFPYNLPKLLKKRVFFTPAKTIEPLTDDFAPVNILKAIKNHNRKWK